MTGSKYEADPDHNGRLSCFCYNERPESRAPLAFGRLSASGWVAAGSSLGVVSVNQMVWYGIRVD